MSSLAEAASKMFSGTLVSRILGQVRLIVLIGALGATAQADAFQVANTIPTTIYNLIAGGVLNAILVPHIVRALKRDDDEYVNRLLTMAGTLLFGVTVILTLSSSLLVTVYASQMAPEWFHLAVAFAFWCVPQVFFYGMYTLLGNVLNARGVFGPYMWAPVVNNIIAIVGLVAYIVVFGGEEAGADPAVWDSVRIASIGAVATLGVAAQAFVLIIPLRKSGFRFRFSWGLRGSGLRSASSMAGWAFAALAVGQLGNLVLVNVSSTANGVAESIAAAGGGFVPSYVAYTGAFAIYMLPQSLITTSLVTALFTRMSANAASKNSDGVRYDLSIGMRVVGVFTMFAAVAFCVLAVPLIQMALPTTKPEPAVGFAAVLVALSIGIPAQAVWSMSQRVSFAYEDARTMFFIQIPMALVVVSGGIGVFVAPAQWWVVIVSATIALSQYLGGFVGYLSLRSKLGRLDGARVLRTYFRLVLAVTPAGAVGWGLLHLWGPVSMGSDFVRFGLASSKVVVIGGLMGLIYLGLLRALKVSELDAIVDPVMRRLGRAPQDARSMVRQDQRKESAVIPLATGDLLSARFRLDRLTHTTSRGAELWEAFDTVMGREVFAFLAPESIREEVLDGARRAAILSDPRLTDVVDVGEQEGAGYVVSARVIGTRVGGLRVDDETARAIVGESAAALEAGRKRGTHHGALTAESITITPTGDVVILGMGYLGLAGKLQPVEMDDQTLTDPPSDGDAPVVASDPVERSLSRSQYDADSLIALRAALGGSAEDIRARNAGDVMRAMAPWGEVSLPAEPDSAAALPLWKRLRSAPPGPAAASAGTASLGGPAAASVGPHELSGPAAAAVDSSSWHLPTPTEIEPAPGFEEILLAGDDGRSTHPAHIANDLPVGAVAVEAASAAADATGAAVSRWAKNSATFAKNQAAKARERHARLAQERAAKQAEAREQEVARNDAASRSTESVSSAPARPVYREAPPREPSRRKVDPGPIVMALMVIALVIAVILSLGHLRGAGAPVTLPPRAEPTRAEVTPTEETEDVDEEEPSVAVAVADPAISRINVLDPEGDGAENPDLTGRAHDGDLTTYWRSRSYVNPEYGMKSGIGIDVELEERALVTEIEIVLAGEGGHVQVKSSPGEAARQEPIAEADMARNTVITFEEPVELENVVLWFTSLPRADSDGKNRVELLEVIVR